MGSADRGDEELVEGLSFGSALRALRSSRGVSLGQLAKIVNYSKSHLSRVETGHKLATESLARACDETLHSGDLLAGLLGPVDGRRGRVSALSQLPRSVPDFVGRAPALRWLDRTGRGAGACGAVLIDGPAGVGKSAAAVHWAQRVSREFPHGVLFADLRGFSSEGEPADPNDVLRDFIAALGGPVEAEPVHHTRLSATYRSLLVGRRVLVVLDNAVTAEQVRPLLPAAPGCFVVITSRCRMSGLTARDGVARLTLPRLSESESLALLAKTARRRPETGTAAELVRRCGYLPLAIRIAAEDTEAWRRAPLDGRDAVPDPATTMRAVLSWSYSKLSVAAAAAFRGIAGRRPAGGVFTLSSAREWLGTSRDTAAELLDLLTGLHLVDLLEPGLFQVDTIVAAYATELSLVAGPTVLSMVGRPGEPGPPSGRADGWTGNDQARTPARLRRGRGLAACPGAGDTGS
ncbi:helix-turn-helix domain-containing protein [Amycolatopsis sp. PS_44_ISF1]|uniref:helix-turn-helix domain-containing protein n=1 Tax=Amycolatopsis sp. PS_44_ISF1 TaxID=2974917 RepID=UPI0028DF00C0|nr:helix-turn-helix domain-containing protein [Amycolatopsis sp. PS_44_ISF1]MDT8912742.1 helix-turn-helix domain-containing protein [Amycolatopsis sp. PS_44_ISF1]